MLQKFKDYSSASSRRALLQSLAITPMRITFVKTDNTVRVIDFTLDSARLSEASVFPENSIRSVFLKAFDVNDSCIKTVRWNSIVDVDNSPSDVWGRNAATASNIDEPKKATRAEEITLLSDLRQVGFVNGNPITDSMLMELIRIRVERETINLVGQINRLSASNLAAIQDTNRAFREITKLRDAINTLVQSVQ